jgi:uncharacterized protein YdhG (YjbR/CyaY superfamily)
MARPGWSSVEEYIAAAAPEVRPILEEIRRVAKAAVPEAQEVISYQMPALKLRRTFFYYAGFKQHIGVYPPVAGDAELARALAPYANAKGNLAFPLKAPMPYELIAEVARALAAQYAK